MIQYQLTDTHILLTGQTFLKRHAIAAKGGSWDGEAKAWKLPLDGGNNLLFAKVELEATALPEGEAPKRGPGRPPGARNKPKDAIPAEGVTIAQIPPTPKPEPIKPHSQDTEGQLAHALAAFVAQHAPQSGQSAPVDMGQVDDRIFSAVSVLHDKLEELREVVNARKADTLIIQNGDAQHEITGLMHKSLPVLIQALGAKLHVWLAGPSGSGKTHAAEQAAQALGLSFQLQGAMTMAHELTGFVDAGGRYHETPFVRAFRSGGLSLLDELDAGSNEALLALNAALANGIMSLPSGENIRAHEDFRCIGAANTFGGGATHEYVGRTRIDAAFLQRFGARISWDYDLDLEVAMSGNANWAKRVQKAREKARAVGLKVLITPRSSQSGARLIASGMTAEQAAELTYLADLTPAQRQQVGG